jgi:intein/homing endonuclease
MAFKAGKRWTSEDKLFLINSINNNLSIKDISIQLERSEYSIKTQIDAILTKVNDNYSNEYNNFLINQIKKKYINIFNSISDIPFKKVEELEEKSVITYSFINPEIKNILNDMIDNIIDEEGLNPKQLEAYKLSKEGKSIFLTGEAGCHVIGTKILMYNGNLKNVEDISIKDKLMGDDSKPRNIKSLIRGYGELYDVEHIETGEIYTVNKHHILTLKCNYKKNIQEYDYYYLVKSFDSINLKIKIRRYSFNNFNKQYIYNKVKTYFYSINDVNIIDISVMEYLNLNVRIKSLLYGFKKEIKFKKIPLAIDPYVMGGIIGIGLNSLILPDTHDYSIPKINLINSKRNRLEFLAGLIDTYGKVINNKFSIYVHTYNDLVNDIKFMVLSLGLYFDFSINNIITIYGSGILQIPTKINKLNKINKLYRNTKNISVYNIKIVKNHHGRYYGFNIDKNQRYVMGNLTITHNCGKTHVLKKIIKYMNNKKKRIGVTGSTGVSATLISGTTIHSFLKIGVTKKPANELYEIIKNRYPIVYNKIKKLEVLIIDEISMIDNILFSKIGKIISLIKEIKIPFGDLQLILCGDFAQIKPVNNTYCFESIIWKILKLNTVLLTEQIRQRDDNEFQLILSQLRYGNMTDEIFNRLKQLKKHKFENDVKPTILYSKNVNVDKINEREYQKLIDEGNKEYIFKIKYNELNKSISKLVKSLDNQEIKLCKGLQVMITYNIDVSNKLVNGTRCVIHDIINSTIIIKTFDNQFHSISYIKYIDDNDSNIFYEYIPLKLAFAITIHKCVNENTLIYTQNGLKRINKISKDIYNDSHKAQITKELSLNVMGRLGYSKATQIYKGDIIDTLKITTSLGYSLEGSHKHPILTYNDKYEEEWKKLSDIKVDDHIIMKYNTQCFGNLISTEMFVKNYKFINNTTKYKIPMYVNEKLAYLIGLLIGDGSYSTEIDYPIDFCCHKDVNIKDIYISYFNELFEADIKIADYTKNKKVFRILKCSKYIREFLLWCGLKYETAINKTIPWVILENTRECHINCLKGLFDTDGGINKDSIHYTSISEQLIIDIQNLLLNLGIISSVNKLTNNSLENHSQAYRLLITGYQAHLFYKYVGFNEIRKQEKLKNKYGEYTNKIKSNILEIPNGKKLINNFRNEIYSYYNVKRCDQISLKLSQFMSRVINNSAKLRLYDLKFIIDKFDDISKFGKNGEKIKYIYENNLLFQKIVKIDNSKSQVYDLYVPGDHSFIGNGVINHNSQGSTISLLEMDLGDDVFEYGQMYTAISRGTNLSIIKLLALSRNSCRCHPKVIEFYKNLE